MKNILLLLLIFSNLMAQEPPQTIPQLPTATGVLSTDYGLIQLSSFAPGSTKKITWANFITSLGLITNSSWSLTSPFVPYWNGTNMANSLMSQGSGLMTIAGTLTLGTQSSVSGGLKMYNAGNAYYQGWQPSGSATGSYLLTMPPAYPGQTGSIFVGTNGGFTSWIVPGATGTVLTSAGISSNPSWQAIPAPTTCWNLTGNSGLTDGTNFIGNTDNIPFTIRTNNIASARIDPLLHNSFYGYKTPGTSPTGKANNGMGYQSMYSLAGGSGNVACGDSSLFSLTSGSYNIGIGYQAGEATTTGTYNTAIGYNALLANTIGQDNVAIGEFACLEMTTTSDMIGIGNNALGSFTNANHHYEVAIGVDAIGTVTNGIYDVGIGYQALGAANGTIGRDVAVGGQALEFYNAGTYCTALGYQALYGNTNGGGGSNNTSVGSASGVTLGNGSNNTFVGAGADVSSATLSNATAIGSNAQVSASNTLVLGSNGTLGTAIAHTQFTGALEPYYSAAYNPGTSGQVLTSQGSGVSPQWLNAAASGWNLTGTNTITAGTNYLGTSSNAALQFLTNATFSGSIDPAGPVLLGYQAGLANTAATNTAIGYQSMISASTTSTSTALGYQSMFSAQGGSANTAIGYQALYHIMSGAADYTGVGYQAGYHATNGGYVTAFGAQAGYSSTSAYTDAFGSGAAYSFIGAGGYDICAMGFQSLYNATGVENTALGVEAGRGITTGGYNTFIGNGAGNSGIGQSATGSYMGAIGYSAWVTGSNMFALGSNLGFGSGSYLFGINNPTPTAQLHIAAGTATAGTAPLKITAGTNLTTPESGAIENTGTHLYWTSSTPTRYQLDHAVVVVASSNLTAQTSAGTIVSYAPGSGIGTFMIAPYVNITAILVDVLNVVVTWTDENSVSQSQTFYPMGTTSASLAATGFVALSPATIRANTTFAITVSTTLATGGGSTTFDAGGTITQVN